MRIAVLGTGAIGGLLGCRLALSGADVVFIDRGERARGLELHGLTVRGASGEVWRVAKPKVARPGARMRGLEAVVLAVKAHEIAAAIPALLAVLEPDTLVLTVQNGIPWWYFERTSGPWAGRRLESVDPDGSLAASIEARRIVGCVAYPAAEVVAPGVVAHVEGNRFPLGELDGSRSERVVRLATLLERAGLKAPVLEDIRSEIWLKAWGNVAFNPLSALTRATMAELASDPDTRALAVAIMRETQAVAERLGAKLRVSLERRLEGAAQVGHHKTSMLQDLEAGRPLELGAICGAVLELAHLTEVPAPSLAAVHALTKRLDAQARRAPETPQASMRQAAPAA